MASIDRPSSRVDFERLRAPVARLWQTIAGARPAVRWGLAAAAFLTLGAASYWGSGTLSPSGVHYLVSGKRFSSEAIIKVCRALEKQRIAYRIDDLRRVEVASADYEQAADTVAKLELGPLSFEDIRGESQSGGIWDGPIEREQKEKRKLERTLEKMIGDQEGVLSAMVCIDRPRAQGFSRNSAKPSAFVYVETDKGRGVSSRSVQAILGFLDGMVPGLEPGSITVMDHRGMRYLDPGNPALGDHSRNRAREEEITEEILEKLDWIKGVRVQVQVIAPRAGELAATTNSGAGRARAAKGAGSGETYSDSRTIHDGAVDERPSNPLIVPNQPISLDGNGDQSPALAPGAGGASSTQSVAIRSRGVSGETADAPRERGCVVVNVPRSFYLNMEIRGDQGKPTLEELRSMADRTERSIRTAVTLLLADPDSWKIDVATFADDVAYNRPTVVPDSTDSRHRLLEWGIFGAVGGGVSILAIAGSMFHLSRRPARVPEPSSRSRRFHAGSVLQPSPSERVRELIQRNPEAAASVLQRWVSHGGRSS